MYRFVVTKKNGIHFDICMGYMELLEMKSCSYSIQPFRILGNSKFKITKYSNFYHDYIWITHWFVNGKSYEIIKLISLNKIWK